MSTNKKSSRSRAAIKESKLCQFPFADGRRCRMLRHSAHPCLCLFHARAESQLVETERFGGELAQTLSGDFMTATDINHAMGRLYTAVAQDRIPLRNANALARIGRIMLGTIPGIKSEFPFSYKFEDWNRMLDATKGLLPTPTPVTPPAPPSHSLNAANPPISINANAAPAVTPPTPPIAEACLPQAGEAKPLSPSVISSPPAQAGEATEGSDLVGRNLSSPLTSIAPLNSRTATQNEKTSPNPTPDTPNDSPPKFYSVSKNSLRRRTT